MERGRFNFRSFTSFILTWTIIALMISGVVLYVAPAGRIANWTGWRMGLLTKDQWRSVHTLTAILFLIGSAFHLAKFNWKPFIAYLRKPDHLKRPFRYELVASLFLFLLIVAGTIFQQVPFQTVMVAGTSIRDSWETASNNPPAPHMEEMPVTQISDSLKVETPQLMGTLHQLGLKSTGQNDSLKDIAKRNGQSPEQIYKALESKLKPLAEPKDKRQPAVQAGAGTGTGAGAGFGRGQRQGFKSLAELAQDYGLSTEAAIKKLSANGITGTAQDRVRDIANRNGLRPYELIEILQSGAKQ